MYLECFWNGIDLNEIENRVYHKLERRGNYMKAIVFDMDGILFDTENLFIKCWQQLAKEYKLENIEAVVKECIGTNEEKTKAIMKSYYGEEFDIAYYHGEAREAFLEYIEENGLPMKKGVRELLDYLKECGYKIGLASSTRVAEVKRELKSVGIDQYFEVIVGGDMVKESKPKPEIYLLACEKLGVEPKETIAIEDSLNGIRAAYSAGMKPIMVPDIVQPTKEIEEILYQKLESLIEVRDFLLKQEKEL